MQGFCVKVKDFEGSDPKVFGKKMVPKIIENYVTSRSLSNL